MDGFREFIKICIDTFNCSLCITFHIPIIGSLEDNIVLVSYGIITNRSSVRISNKSIRIPTVNIYVLDGFQCLFGLLSTCIIYNYFLEGLQRSIILILVILNQTDRNQSSRYITAVRIFAD